MKSHTIGKAAILMLLALSGIPHGARAQENPLLTLDWMAGCWEQRQGESVTTEMWSAPAGALMIGGSHTVIGDRSRMFEHLRITRGQETLVYTAIPSGQAETDFTATMISDTLVVFENPEHDFPTRIDYRPVAPDSLVARVTGPGDDGSEQGFYVRMRRIPCGSGQ